MSESNVRWEDQEDLGTPREGRSYSAVAESRFQCHRELLGNVAPWCGQKSLFKMDCHNRQAAWQQGGQNPKNGLVAAVEGSRKGMEAVDTSLASLRF